MRSSGRDGNPWRDYGDSENAFEVLRERFSVVEFDKEASQTRGSWVAKNATLRAARPDSSPRKERLFDWITTTAPRDRRVDLSFCEEPRLGAKGAANEDYRL
jgi:hypothetical protein